MKRPVFSFRPNRKDRNHRKAWSILEKVPEGEKSQFVVDAILFYDQADALEQLIRKSVREHSRYMLMLYGQIGILIVLLKMKLSLNRMAMELVNICLIKYRKLN